MLWWIAETSLVAGALALVAGLATRIRPLGPAARHALWLVVLVKLLTPPVVESPWAWPVETAGPSLAADGTREGACDERPGARTEVVTSDHPPGEPVGPPSDFNLKLAGVSVLHLRLTGGDGSDGDSVVVEDQVEPREVEAAGPLAADPTKAPERWWSWSRVDWTAVGGWLFAAWVAVTAVVTAGQAWRVLRFSRRLRHAVPAPEWIVAELEALADRFGVRAPEALAVPGLGVPMLWCLGRPKLLLPAHLLKTLGSDRWRGVLAHELAHLKRGDHWVSRLSLLAGLVWWWNPVYWLARSRIDAEAELACDAWVVWALPGDRVVYAGTMLDICESLCRTELPPLAPALGVSGTGRLFERRLTMILKDRVPYRLSLPGLIGPGLLALMGLPSWTAAAPAIPRTGELAVAAVAVADDDDEKDKEAEQARAEQARAKAEIARAKSEIERAKLETQRAEKLARAQLDRVKVALKLAEAQGSDGAKEKEQHLRQLQRAQAQLKEAFAQQSKLQKDQKSAVRKEVRVRVQKDEDKEDAEKDEDAEKAEKDFDFDFDFDLSELSEMFGPDSEFIKGLEKLGPELEKLLQDKLGPGSDFEGKMKDLGTKIGKELKEKLGPGSDFERMMKDVAKTLKEQLGPGSDFEKNIKEQLGPGSDFEKHIKEFSSEIAKRAKDSAEDVKKETKDETVKEKEKPKETTRERVAPARPEVRPRFEIRRDRRAQDVLRERRVQQLEAQIKALSRELEKMKDENKDEPRDP